MRPRTRVLTLLVPQTAPPRRPGSGICIRILKMKLHSRCLTSFAMMVNWCAKYKVQTLICLDGDQVILLSNSSWRVLLEQVQWHVFHNIVWLSVFWGAVSTIISFKRESSFVASRWSLGWQQLRAHINHINQFWIFNVSRLNPAAGWPTPLIETLKLLWQSSTN